MGAVLNNFHKKLNLYFATKFSDWLRKSSIFFLFFRANNNSCYVDHSCQLKFQSDSDEHKSKYFLFPNVFATRSKKVNLTVTYFSHTSYATYILLCGLCYFLSKVNSIKNMSSNISYMHMQ